MEKGPAHRIGREVRPRNEGQAGGCGDHGGALVRGKLRQQRGREIDHAHDVGLDDVTRHRQVRPCWIAADGASGPIRIEEGDAFVLTQGRSFRLASDLSLPATDAATLFPAVREGGTVVLGSGGTFSLAGARFTVNGSAADLLLGLLPPSCT